MKNKTPRKRLAFLSILFLGLISISIAKPKTANDAAEWYPIFNGKNLDGWSVQCQEADKEKNYWSVQDGVIVCDSMGDKNHNYVWLQFDTEYSDFELKLKFRGFRESPGNSGVQIRSRYDQTENGGWLDGPQIDINPRSPFRNGLIYDETRSENRWIHPSLPNWSIKEDQSPSRSVFHYSDESDGWNDMHITCKGTRITTKVNGILISDYDGSGVLDNASHRSLNVGMRGYIALQLHKNNELKAHFKDLYVKPL